jgi:transcription-repair coupling factor (superfamily II helicase)
LILESFQRLVRREGLLERLPDAGERLVLAPLPGAAAPALAAALAEEGAPLVVLVGATPGEAETAAADLEALEAAERAAYFPQREALPHEDRDPHVEIAAERVRALERLLRGRCRVLVTTARALVERTPVPSGGGPLELELAEGMEVAREALTGRLASMGFEQVHTVSELGEFAVRGGIVDLFPFGSQEPVRVELWGDEVASLRRFDLTSQRSTGSLDRIEVLPVDLEAAAGGNASGDGQGDRAGNASGGGQGDRAGNGTGDGRDERDGTGGEPHATERRALLELLPDGALLFDLAPDSGPDRRQRLWEETEEARRRGGGSLATGELLMEPDAAEARIGRLRRLERPEEDADISPDARDRPADDGAGPAPGAGSNADGAPVLDLGFDPPPTVDRDMTVLVDQISSRLDRGERVLVLCDNRGQMERLEEILEERGGGALARETTLGLGSLSGGFRVPGADRPTDAEAGDRDARPADRAEADGGPADPPLTVLTDHEIFQRSHRLRRSWRTQGAATLETIASLEAGDYVVHLDHGIGRYRGMERLEIGGETVETLKIEYADDEILRVPHYRLDLIERWSATDGGEAKPPRVHKLGGRRWKKLKERTVDSIQETAAELLELYAHRQVVDGHAFSEDTKWQKEFESSFLYEETPDQLEAWAEVKADMEEPRPMDRLICGDVGYGKTEVAMRAAFKAVQDGKQVAVLAPTTVLVEQHLHTFRERMAGFPVVIEMLSRFQTSSRQEEIVEGLEEGSVDIVVGTHRLLSSDVTFRDLGLLVVDEEQRFGVRQKERLKDYKRAVDVLTLTATPIPRTLQLALGGLRDLSVIETAPRDRMPVVTHVLHWNDPVLRDAMRRELDRGGQVFFVHDRVQTIGTLAERVRRLVPEAEVAVAHGQMPERKLERTMERLMAGEVDVLVSTSIIENGLDVPTANTMVVHRADMFGLSQLYQLRGRVGRSHHRAYCYLLVPDDVTPEAEKRLKILEHHTELGAGYQVALKDLELRGAGNLLGESQSGFAQAVGFETYRRLLEKTIGRLKGEEDGAREPPQVSLDGEAFLPDDYILDGEQKMNLYRRISRLETREEVEEMRDELRDRFGPPPEPVRRLLSSVELKVLGTSLRAEWIRVSDGRARLNFRADAVPRMKLLRDAFHDRQLDVDVRRTQPLSLVLEQAGVEPVLPTLLDALSVLAETEEAGARAAAGG